jgi:hypothetical protein
MKRFWLALTLVGLFALTGGPLASAQEMKSSPVYSDAQLKALGYPEVTIAVSEAGVDAPQSLSPGIYHVTLTVDGPNVGYVDFMQPPAGLSADEMRTQALDAGANDLVRPGWGFAGGGNTFAAGAPVSFLIDLAAGDYQIAASYYPAEGEYDIANEHMTMIPLHVGDSATPGAVATPTVEPKADVTVEMTDDLRYVISQDNISAGPHLWKIANTGTMHSHHMVLFKVPDGVTADQIIAAYTTMMSGTPTAEPPLMAQFEGSAYAALQSGGHTTWNEFDLKPGTYALICFISDSDMGMPHLFGGMVTVFTVS